MFGKRERPIEKFLSIPDFNSLTEQQPATVVESNEVTVTADNAWVFAALIRGGNAEFNVNGTGWVKDAVFRNGDTIKLRATASTVPSTETVINLYAQSLNKQWSITTSESNNWTPANLGASLELWLDADDASTITLNGSTVSQWDDKSGNGRNISQAVASQQPTWNATGLNNKPILTFDGVNDVLLNPTVGAAGLSNVSIISVFRQITGGGNEDHQINIGQTGTTGKVRGFYKPPNGTVLQFGGWASVATSTLSLDIGGSHHIFGFANSALSGSNNMLLMKDGTTELLTTSITLNTTLDGFSVGSLQGEQVGSYYSNISVAEIVVLYSDIGTLDRQKLEGYLAHKWGLAANLPVDHPYKDAAPTV